MQELSRKYGVCIINRKTLCLLRKRQIEIERERKIKRDNKKVKKDSKRQTGQKKTRGICGREQREIERDL